jgi:hypothetical protein
LESGDKEEEGKRGRERVKVNSRNSGSSKGEEFTKGSSLTNTTTFSKTEESPEKGKEIREESFYEQIPFVVLGPTLKIGSATYKVYVPPGVKEGAYWIPIRIDENIHYVGVLLKEPWKPPVVKKEVKKKEIWEEEPFLVYFAIIFFAGLVLILSYLWGKREGRKK